MEFADFATAHGLVIDHLYPSERIRRCATVDNPRKKNGAYLYLGDRGWVQRWDEGGDVVWWKDPNAKERTQEDIDQWRAQRRAAELEAERRHGDAASKAKAMIESAKTTTHAYLGIKGFPNAIGLVLDEQLLLPMRNYETNALQGVQTIHWDEAERKYIKKMLYGTRARNAALILGARSNVDVCLCEGYATGLSIQAACKSIGLPTSVWVTFSANNLALIASQIKTTRRAWVFADNDESGTGERVARESGLPFAMSSHTGMDANDHHLKHGVMDLSFLIMKARNQC